MTKRVGERERERERERRKKNCAAYLVKTNASTSVTRCNGKEEEEKNGGIDDYGVGAVRVMKRERKELTMGQYGSDDRVDIEQKSNFY